MKLTTHFWLYSHRLYWIYTGLYVPENFLTVTVGTCHQKNIQRRSAENENREALSHDSYPEELECLWMATWSEIAGDCMCRVVICEFNFICSLPTSKRRRYSIRPYICFFLCMGTDYSTIPGPISMILVLFDREYFRIGPIKNSLHLGS